MLQLDVKALLCVIYNISNTIHIQNNQRHWSHLFSRFQQSCVEHQCDWGYKQPLNKWFRVDIAPASLTPAYYLKLCHLVILVN